MLNTKENRAQARAAMLKGYEVQAMPELSAVVGLKDNEENGRFYLIAFKGSAGRPALHYSYKSEARRAAALESWLEGLRANQAFKDEQKAKNGGKSNLSGVALTAQKIRERLKAEFPGVKFSVKSSTYSMGDSVTASWTDGPVHALVQSVLNEYQNSRFCGMTDTSEFLGVAPALGCDGTKHATASRTISEERESEIIDFYFSRFGFDAQRISPAAFEAKNPECWPLEYQERANAEQKAAQERREAEQQAEKEEQRKRAERESALDAEISEEAARLAEIYAKNTIYTISITWSENKALNNLAGVKMHPRMADELFLFADKKTAGAPSGGYYKTAFEVSFDGEAVYSGRYDMGDDDGGLFEHIRGVYGSEIYQKSEELREKSAAALQLVDDMQALNEGASNIFSLSDKLDQKAKTEHEDGEKKGAEIFSFLETLSADQLEVVALHPNIDPMQSALVCALIFKKNAALSVEVLSKLKERQERKETKSKLQVL